MHIPHRLHISLLALFEFSLERMELVVEHRDVAVQPRDILTDRIDGATLVSNLIVDDHQVLQAFLHVTLISLQFPLLLLNLLTDLNLLRLQRVDRRSRSLLGRGLLTSLTRLGGLLRWCLFLWCRHTASGCLLPGSLLLRLLGRDNHHHTDYEPE